MRGETRNRESSSSAPPPVRGKSLSATIGGEKNRCLGRGAGACLAHEKACSGERKKIQASGGREAPWRRAKELLAPTPLDLARTALCCGTPETHRFNGA
jgi:hypothetical protein